MAVKHNEDLETRQERRAQRLRNRRKMAVHGRSLRKAPRPVRPAKRGTSKKP